MGGANTPIDHLFNTEMYTHIHTRVCVRVCNCVQSQIGTDNEPCEILHEQFDYMILLYH